MPLLSTPLIPPNPKPVTKPKPARKPVNPYDIISAKLTYPQCVQLLHYHRLVAHCIQALQQFFPSAYPLQPLLANYLLTIITEFDSKTSTHLSFTGPRGALREEKIKTVVKKYLGIYKERFERGDLGYTPTTLAEVNAGLRGMLKEMK